MLNPINKQSPDIAGGVSVDDDHCRVGDQEIMFEYPSVSEEARCQHVWKVTDALETGDLR